MSQLHSFFYTKPKMELHHLQQHRGQCVLAILFVVFLVLGQNIPYSLAEQIDSPFGKVVVGASALCLFAYMNPILAILGMFVAYELIRRSSEKTGSNTALFSLDSPEAMKWRRFPPRHQFPATLEQEVIQRMTTHRLDTEFQPTEYRPVLDNTHDAEYIH